MNIVQVLAASVSDGIRIPSVSDPYDGNVIPDEQSSFDAAILFFVGYPIPALATIHDGSFNLQQRKVMGNGNGW
jgi:hypothetical protein